MKWRMCNLTRDENFCKAADTGLAVVFCSKTLPRMSPVSLQGHGILSIAENSSPVRVSARLLKSQTTSMSIVVAASPELHLRESPLEKRTDMCVFNFFLQTDSESRFPDSRVHDAIFCLEFVNFAVIPCGLSRQLFTPQ